MLACEVQILAHVWHVYMYTILASMELMALNLTISHKLCENVNVTMKTTITFNDMTTLQYFVIKEKFE